MRQISLSLSVFPCLNANSPPSISLSLPQNLIQLEDVKVGVPDSIIQLLITDVYSEQMYDEVRGEPLSAYLSWCVCVCVCEFLKVHV